MITAGIVDDDKLLLESNLTAGESNNNCRQPRRAPNHVIHLI